MATTTAKAFDEFHDKLLPTSAQKGTMSTRRAKTHDYLQKEFGSNSDMPLIETKLIGSAARHTIIRPIDDIDVLAVFSDENNIYEDKYQYNSQDFLQRIRNALSDYRIQTVGTRGQAVRLFYQQNPHVDIAAVFHEGNGVYLLPAGDGSWIRTSPSAQKDWLKERSEIIGSVYLRKVTRLLKRWNNVHGHRFKSFHLEVLITTLFSNLDGDSREALALFFENAYGVLTVQDPAGYGGDLSSYMTWDDRQSLNARLSNAAARARNAISAAQDGNHEEAIRLWRIELGDEFPTY